MENLSTPRRDKIMRAFCKEQNSRVLEQYCPTSVMSVCSRIPRGIKGTSQWRDKSRSRAVSTERTILSPFTKEYRVLAAPSGIRLFLEGPSFGVVPTLLSLNFLIK